jgi:hypothetical protein
MVQSLDGIEERIVVEMVSSVSCLICSNAPSSAVMSFSSGVSWITIEPSSNSLYDEPDRTGFVARK